MSTYILTINHNNSWGVNIKACSLYLMQFLIIKDKRKKNTSLNKLSIFF
jgi:hypothetical protein